MRHLGVVLPDEERDQGADAFEGVERVEEQPPMFQRAPPGFDHRVRFGDLDLGEDPVKAFGKKGRVDGGVDVLDTGVRHDCDSGSWSRGSEMPAGLDKYPAGRSRIETRADGPGQDPSREVVHDGVDERLAAVEQLEDRDVDVPKVVGAGGANADGGLGRMDAKTRAAAAAVANKPCPGTRGGKDPADALGVEAQSAQGHVPVLGSENHVLVGGDLGGGELAGHGAWTWRAIIEAADDGDTSPGVVARRRHAQDAQDEGEGEGALGAGDSA
jgi:hypothetical protein